MAESDEIDAAFHALMEAQRTRCLWYLRSDWRPATVEEMLRVLDAIERHGDRAAFLEAARIRAALATNSTLPSATVCG